MSSLPIPAFEAPRRVLLAAPRGYCAGVERAIDIVEVALATYGPPVYVRKQIVHNLHVVKDLETRGAVFVEELDEVPEGSTVVFSAHGVAPSVHAEARERGLRVIDATCPLVTKVHQEARKFAAKGYDIVLIGHEGHEEVVGTMGHAPRAAHLVGDEEEAARVEVADPERVAYLTQTTLSVDETAGVIDTLRGRFPVLAGPRSDDICYATQNRQAAVKALAPDWLVDELVAALRERGATEVRQVEVVPEDVHFALPGTLRRDAEAVRAE